MRPSPVLLALLFLFVGGDTLRADEQVWLRSFDATGQPYDLSSERGRVVALTFASRHMRDEAEEVNDALSARAGEDFQVVSVVDFTDVPQIGWGSAKKQVARHDRPGRIQFLVDETGQLKHAFRVDPRSRVDILVIDQQGILRGRYAGLRQLDDAVREIERLRHDEH
jgi:hypothetical protein